MTPYQVIWKGPVHKKSGLGIASRSYVQALKRQGVDVRVGAISNRYPNQGKTKSKKILIYHHLPYTINFKKERKQYDRIVLNTVCPETTRIPKRWQPNMNKFDAVCVPSVQNKEALRHKALKFPYA